MIIPKIQPIASAKKSKTLQYLFMKRCFCSISVKPPYAIVDKTIVKNNLFL